MIELIYAADGRTRSSGTPASMERRSAGELHRRARRRSRGGAAWHPVSRNEIDKRGIVRAANLLVATQQNSDALNRSIAQAAASHVLAADEPLLNAVEFAIRCYDPCLSCATHVLGRIPLEIEVRRGTRVVRRARRRA